MASQYNPKSWLSLNLDNPKQQRVFMQQLVQYLIDNFSSSGLASILNGTQTLVASSILSEGSNLGSLSTNTTFNCKGAVLSVVVFSFTAAITLTLSNLPIGAIVILAPKTSSSLILKLAATTPAGAAYTTITATLGATGSANNMITTGVGQSGSLTYVGGTLTGPELNLLGG